jgi:hypothetical protein
LPIPPARPGQTRPDLAHPVQPALHEHRRGHGADAPEHRPLGEYPRAPGFLLRPVRRSPAISSPTRPHIPVHLGSMGDSVRAILNTLLCRSESAGMRPGDAYLINSPYAGGTHLPDITVVSPIFDPSRRRTLRYFVASRAHHADVGGISPGSMPAAAGISTRKAVCSDGLLIVRDGCNSWNFGAYATGCPEIRPSGPQSGPEPGRPAAQVAANVLGTASPAATGRRSRRRARSGVHGLRAGQRRSCGEAAPRPAARRGIRPCPG